LVRQFGRKNDFEKLLHDEWLPNAG
jgi:hypothetical protein